MNINLDSPVAKRIKKSNENQEKHAPCIICKANFDNCPHSLAEVENVIAAYRVLSATVRYFS